jgi:uncharacterized repeat protein (TIGR01451 family)
VKELSFEVSGAMQPNTKNYNWVVLAPWNTLSGPQAPITRGAGAGPRNGLLNVYKTADTDFIPPGEPTDVKYNIAIQNWEQSNDKIVQIDDYLPPGFVYINNSTGGGFTTINPQYEQWEEINGVWRWHLRWTFSPAVSIASGTTLHLTFHVSATQSESGTYYNEMMIIPNNPVPGIFSDLGILDSDFNSSYTWNASPVLVPYYDSRADAGETTIDANIGNVEGGGVAIKSWQVY